MGFCHEERPTKRNEKPAGKNREAGVKLSGHGSAHFYTGVPPVSSRALRGSLSDRIRMRQTGRRGRCFRCGHRHLPLPPRAAALAPLRGYPKLMVAVLPYGSRRHGQLPSGPVASSKQRRSKHDHKGGSPR